MSIVCKTQRLLFALIPLLVGAVATPIAAQSKSVAGSALNLDAIVLKPLPAAAVALSGRLSARLSPAVAAWIQSDGRALVGRGLGSDALVAAARGDVAGRFAGQKLNAPDVETLAMLVLMQANLAAQADLQALMAELKASQGSKQAMRSTTAAAANKANAMGDLSQEQSLRLQVAMERQAKAFEALSNIMQKVSATADSIIANLK